MQNLQALPARGKGPARHHNGSRVPKGRQASLGQPVAVIDVGSNSGRIVVFRVHAGGHLEILSDARAPLRLAHELDANGKLSRVALDRTIAALRDFRAVAQGVGAERILAVATSAVRESINSDVLLSRARNELGLEVEVIDGRREALCAFLGAVHGMPVRHGLLLDLGGGSLEITHFRNRKLRRTWTLALGALRVSDRFLDDDPPTAGQMRRLREHVAETLEKAGVPPLARDEVAIGTGGTIRNIAEIDRRSRLYPIAALHGYVLSTSTVWDVAKLVSGLPLAARAGIRGLSKDRGDSIVGGSLTVHTAMQLVEAREILVSGQGLREGVLLATLGDELPDVPLVRATSIAALAQRFRGWSLEVAGRRAQIARQLLEALVPDSSPEMREILGHAAAVLDIGRSLDYYNRHRHAALIVASAGLNGFSHRGIALLSAVLYQADNGDARLKSYRSLLRSKDEVPILRCAVLLALADEMERRSPQHRPVAFTCEVREEEVVLKSEALAAWKPRGVGDRFHMAFGRELRIARS
jgi:exopolyphosphatase/guanosine-5'-triphosphate,3'-diphosphate pyrophosphatase